MVLFYLNDMICHIFARVPLCHMETMNLISLNYNECAQMSHKNHKGRQYLFLKKFKYINNHNNQLIGH